MLNITHKMLFYKSINTKNYKKSFICKGNTCGKQRTIKKRWGQQRVGQHFLRELTNSQTYRSNNDRKTYIILKMRQENLVVKEKSYLMMAVLKWTFIEPRAHLRSSLREKSVVCSKHRFVI